MCVCVCVCECVCDDDDDDDEKIIYNMLDLCVGSSLALVYFVLRL